MACLLWHHQIMQSIVGTNKKRGRGRPFANTTSLNVRVPPNLLSALDSWITDQPDPKPTRPEAVRRLLSQKLNVPDEDIEALLKLVP